MPFCHAPWTNIDISPQGKIRPCCKFRHEYYSAPLDIRNSLITDYVTSKTLLEIKQDFKKNRWPKGCERCRIEEENSIKSKRQLDHDRWASYYNKHDFESNEFLTASIAFGNTCNLTCITCGPESSSRWQKEYRALFGVNVPSNHFYKHGFIDEVISSMPGLIHIDIPGGEPFLSGVDQQQELLNGYKHRANEIGLHYTTNATLFPEQSWWDLWQDFREIDLQISLDGIEKKLEYIRYPAIWDNVRRNIDQYLIKQTTLNNFRLSVSVTVSAYNIAYLDELLDWCCGVGLPKPWLGRVHNPLHMRPSIWPMPAHDFIMAKLRSREDLQSWANMLQSVDDTQYFETFKTVTLKHDEYRGTDFAKVFPEMGKFL